MSSARIKCWINSDGVKECGNVVPPEYAQQSHEVISNHGITVDHTDRAKTEEELAEEERLAALKAKEEARAKEKAIADRVLLETFSSEQDMVLTRDGMLSAIDSQVELARSHIDELENNLDELIANAADMERRGEQPPEKLIKDIDSVRAQIKEKLGFIEQQRQEQENVSARFDRDIQRFRELRGGNSETAANPQY